MLSKYAKKIDPEYPVLDSTLAEFAQWEQNGWQLHGMQHKFHGREHGIIRGVKENSQVLEGTYKNGRAHGIRREVYDDKTIVSMWRDGEVLARIEFDQSLRMVGKND